MKDNHWDEPDKQSSSAEVEALEGKAPVDAKLASSLQGAREGDQKEWKLIEKIVGSLHLEQRRARRWGIFFKLLTFAYLFALMGIFFIGKDVSSAREAAERQPHTALIEIKGIIVEGADASADNVVTALRKAFSSRHSEAILLRINSPGGSPVQAGYINDEITRLRALHPDKKVYAVISDVGASGGYYVAVAADEIYADKASLVGSIGVTASSFGFVDMIDKLGIERRIMTSGDNKAFLDPFSPLKADEKAFWQTVLDTTHQQFIRQVEQGRGERLKGGDELYSGLVWSGEQALELGLIDGLGSASHVAREVIQVPKLVDYTHRPSPFDRFIDRLGVVFATQLATQLSHQLLPKLQ